MIDDKAATLKVLGVMTKVWDSQPRDPREAQDWEQHAQWFAGSIKSGRPRAEMDRYMSRAQLLLKMHSSMDFRKIVDRSIETMNAPEVPAINRVQKLNPTAA
jgi:hypothetical protein